jgi:RNA polymerase sigma-70 factor (ECF subfamily)
MEEIPESIATPEMDPGDKTRQEIENWFLPFIQRLPEDYREALILSEIKGMPQKDVALKQGLSISGAISRIQRGRSMLKEMLMECCRFEFDHLGNVIDYDEKGEDCDKC